MNKLLICAAVLCAAAPGESALAAPAPQGPSVRVRYADLDLASPSGRATLESRVKAAVRQLCPRNSVGGFYAVLEHKKCILETTAQARRRTADAVARAEQSRPADSALAAR